MANSSAKKLAKANASRLQTLQLVIGISTAFYGLIRGVLRRRTFGTADAVVWGILSAVYALTYGFLHTNARPTMENGRVVVAGEDIGASGLMEYVNDLIYITVLIQFGCAFSHWALLGFLIVPGFAIYMFATMGKGDAPQGEDSSAADARQAELAGMSRKERRKFERDERKGR